MKSRNLKITSFYILQADNQDFLFCCFCLALEAKSNTPTNGMSIEGASIQLQQVAPLPAASWDYVRQSSASLERKRVQIMRCVFESRKVAGVLIPSQLTEIIILRMRWHLPDAGFGPRSHFFALVSCGNRTPVPARRQREAQSHRFKKMHPVLTRFKGLLTLASHKR